MVDKYCCDFFFFFGREKTTSEVSLDVVKINLFERSANCHSKVNLGMHNDKEWGSRE